MPLAIPFLGLLAAFAVIFFLVALNPAMRIAIEDTVDNVSIIGGRLKQAVGIAFTAVGNYLREYAHDYEVKLGAWFNALAGSLRSPLDELRAFTTTTKTALEYIATELIPAKIRAVTNPITTRVNGVVARVDTLRGDLTDFSGGIEARVRQLTEQVWDRAIGPVAALGTALNDFRTGIEARVRQLTEQLWTSAIQPIGRITDFELPNIRIDAADLRRAVDALREWAVPISLAFTGAAVVELLRHVRKCKPKTEKLCDFDIDAFDDLIGLTFAVPSLAMIVETMRVSVKTLEEVMPDIRETLR